MNSEVRSILRFLNPISENQHHHFLGSLRPDGVQALEFQYCCTTSEFSQLVVLGHPELALYCDSASVFSLHFCSQNSVANRAHGILTRGKRTGFFDCPASFTLENGYLEIFQTSLLAVAL